MKLLAEDKKLLFEKFPFSKSVGMKCRLSAKTVDYELAQLSAH